ncbi:hypothetical protein HES64_002486 [Salmonella enterica]|nr:hypothetical protein [Salmonella enterica subsp. enterica serovar Aba]EEU6142073.1 hypothetical protein [Salmonella enterica]
MIGQLILFADQVFPAPAGINRTFYNLRGLLFRVPRASGDKPVVVRSDYVIHQCSPRQRG